MMAEDREELVAIVAAREDELAPLRERVLVSEEIMDGPRNYVVGKLRGVQVVLAVTGDGKRNADLGIRRLIQTCAPTRVLAVGLGGALSVDLAVGDLVVSSEVMEGEQTTSDGWLRSTRSWRRPRASRSGGGAHGAISPPPLTWSRRVSPGWRWPTIFRT